MRDSLFLKSKTVLFAEDDIAMRTEMVKVLTMIFKEVLVAEDGEEALRLYEEETPDILITDIKMPKRDGVSLIRRIRKEDYQFPIVLMTSYTEKKFLLDVVNLSIDAYLIKPVELNQLVSALKSAFQRLPIRESIISLGKSFYYNTATKELYHDGNLIVLGVREHDFLKLLIDNLNRTVTKSEISEILWPLDPMSDSALKNLVLRLRKKLNGEIIISVRGIGYRIDISNVNSMF